MTRGWSSMKNLPQTPCTSMYYSGEIDNNYDVTLKKVH